MKKVLSISLIMLLGMPLMAVEFVTIGTGGVTGTYYPTGGAVCRLVNKYKKRSKVRCSVESTGGSVYNINNIRSQDLDLGMAQSDVVYQAYNGTGKFEGKPYKKLRSVMAIYPEILTFVASKRSKIKSITGVKGKKLNLDNYGSGTRATTKRLLKAYGIDEDDLKLAGSLKSAEAPDALRDKKIDGYFYVVGHPTANIKDAANSTDIAIVPLKGKKIDGLIKKYPYYAKGVIAGGLYRGVKKDVQSFGVKAVLVASTNVSDHAVYTITKAILDNFDDFKKLHPAYSKITKESLLEGLSAPLHKGAKKYFEEDGLL